MQTHLQGSNLQLDHKPQHKQDDGAQHKQKKELPADSTEGAANYDTDMRMVRRKTWAK